MYYMIAPTGSDLYHHGILGQKWGRKNGPPYPLGASDHSAAEKKAGYQKSLQKGKYQEYNKYSKPYSKMGHTEAQDSYMKNRKIALKNAKEAFKDIKRTAKLANRYDKKMSEGKESKITIKELVGKEIAEASLDKYYESIDHSSKLAVDNVIKRAATTDIAIASGLFGLAGSVPSAVKNQRALNYINNSSGIKAYKNGDRSNSTLKRMSENDLAGVVLNESRNPVGKNHKKVINDFHKAINGKSKDDRFDIEREYMNKDASAILKDLGFKDTPENREIIRKKRPDSLWD